MTTLPPSRSRARAARLAAAALGLTVVLGACGSGASSSTSSTTSPSGDGSSTGTPLEQLLTGNGASQRALEDAIAACMRERGWQYTPNTTTNTPTPSVSTDSEAFRRQYGYGISTQPPMEAFGLVGSTTGGADDPNGKYLASLSDADKARYQKDLYGDIVVGVPADGTGGGAVAASPADGPGPDTCAGRAEASVAKEFPEMSREFSTRLTELMTGMADDPTMKTAMTAWSTCMAKANFTYASVDEVYQDLQKRAGDIFGSGGGPAADGAVMVGGGPTASLSPSDQDRLAKLQADELAIAKADDACAVDTIDKVRPELERQVVDKLRSEFPGVGSGK